MDENGEFKAFARTIYDRKEDAVYVRMDGILRTLLSAGGDEIAREVLRKAAEIFMSLEEDARRKR